MSKDLEDYVNGLNGVSTGSGYNELGLSDRKTTTSTGSPDQTTTPRPAPRKNNSTKNEKRKAPESVSVQEYKRRRTFFCIGALAACAVLYSKGVTSPIAYIVGALGVGFLFGKTYKIIIGLLVAAAGLWILSLITFSHEPIKSQIPETYDNNDKRSEKRTQSVSQSLDDVLESTPYENTMDETVLSERRERLASSNNAEERSIIIDIANLKQKLINTNKTLERNRSSLESNIRCANYYDNLISSKGHNEMRDFALSDCQNSIIEKGNIIERNELIISQSNQKISDLEKRLSELQKAPDKISFTMELSPEDAAAFKDSLGK